MCVAELNVSLSACQHRWYHLLRPCIPGGTLNSCPGKIAIEGWEIRCDFCPFCAGWPLEAGEFLLFGGHPHSRSSSISMITPLSRTPSMTTAVAVARRDSRRSSLARTDSNTSAYNGLAAAALGSPVHAASERNRAMNSRVDMYFESLPENVMEMRGKRAPSGWNNLVRADEEDEDVQVRRGSVSTASSGSVKKPEVVAEKPSSVWKKAKRRSRDVTSFFR